MPELTLKIYRGTAMEMFQAGITAYQSLNNEAIPRKVTLSRVWLNEMQHAFGLVVAGQEVEVCYRKNQDRNTVKCD